MFEADGDDEGGLETANNTQGMGCATFPRLR